MNGTRSAVTWPKHVLRESLLRANCWGWFCVGNCGSGWTGDHGPFYVLRGCPCRFRWLSSCGASPTPVPSMDGFISITGPRVTSHPDFATICCALSARFFSLTWRWAVGVGPADFYWVRCRGARLEKRRGHYFFCL